MATVNGTSGNDELFGFSTADTINGFAGSDQIFGDAGDDLLLAGAGDDTVIGGEGNDSLTGDDGNDLLNASEGNDVLDGGLGNDALTGGTGNDTVTGGLGNDIAYYAGNQGDFKFALNAVGNVVVTDLNTLDGDDALEIEVEYQNETIGKYGLEMHGDKFKLTNKKTDCLAKEKCGIPPIAKVGEFIGIISKENTCCAPGTCC